ncbi:hypothetical protein ACVWWQ_003451 [Rhodanobacter sp. TND4EL1]
MTLLNLTDKRLNNEAGQEIIDCYEKGRRVSLPKRGQFFELPLGGNERLVPYCDEWILKINDAIMTIRPASNSVRGWFLIIAVLCFFVSIFSWISSLPGSPSNDDNWDLISLVGGGFFTLFGIAITYMVLRQPIGWPTLFSRCTGQVVQMQGRNRVEAAWSDLRPFIERTYTPQGRPIWRLQLIQTDASNKVVKNIAAKVMAERADDCARYYEYLHRYMLGQWEGIPDTLLVSGMRRSLLREFRNSFGWMFGKQRPWAEKPLWLKTLTIMLLPVLTFVFWPLGFFVLVGSRLGWVPKFSREDEQAASGGTLPPELAPRIHVEPPLALTEKLLYTTIIVVSTVVWGAWAYHYLGLFFHGLLSGT